MQSKHQGIKCADFTYSITLGFWSRFSHLKLNQLKLNQEPLCIKGTYSFSKGYKALLELDQYSFINYNESSIKIKGGYLRSQSTGLFVNYNTLDQLKKAFTRYQEQLNNIISQKTKHTQFVVFAYSDLKNFSFYYLQDFKTFEKLRDKIQKSDTNQIDQFMQLKDEQDLQPLNHVSNNQLCPIYFMLDPSNNLPSIMIHSLFRQIYPQKIQASKEFEIILLRQKLTSIKKEKMKLTDQNIAIKVSLHPSEQAQSEPQVFSQIKCVRLKEFLDPKQLAAQAIWLNLKLMKWRAAPSLNLEVISPTKCLLFGSGSLGCQVSRQLLAWGFSHITLIDNGKISHSNPVRQSLFTFQNAANGNQFKAEIAAKAILQICPSAKVKAVNMTIPMPGHPPPVSKQQGNDDDEYKKVMSDVECIQELVKEHDAIFLLTDNRQSRWLPTVLSSLYDKICITAALGFDTFVVMRHGCVEKISNSQNSKEEDKKNNEDQQNQKLGCYFCGDIVAPQNSMKDRTLDQQCTVSRPGKYMTQLNHQLALCPMASSWAVQLLVSILNHPDKQRAKGHQELFQCGSTVLGPIPQQIRGNLKSFQNLALCGYSFQKQLHKFEFYIVIRCVACSDKIIQAYLQDREKLIRAVLQNSDYLEDISGITQMNQALDGEDIDEFIFD